MEVKLRREKDFALMDKAEVFDRVVGIVKKEKEIK